MLLWSVACPLCRCGVFGFTMKTRHQAFPISADRPYVEHAPQLLHFAYMPRRSLRTGVRTGWRFSRGDRKQSHVSGAHISGAMPRVTSDPGHAVVKLPALRMPLLHFTAVSDSSPTGPASKRSRIPPPFGSRLLPFSSRILLSLRY